MDFPVLHTFVLSSLSLALLFIVLPPLPSDLLAVFSYKIMLKKKGETKSAVSFFLVSNKKKLKKAHTTM